MLGAGAVDELAGEVDHLLTPLLYIRMRAVSVTSATSTTSMFSSRSKAMNAATSFASTTTAMRSCDSLMASSVEFRPLYFVGTRSR